MGEDKHKLDLARFESEAELAEAFRDQCERISAMPAPDDSSFDLSLHGEAVVFLEALGKEESLPSSEGDLRWLDKGFEMGELAEALADLSLHTAAGADGIEIGRAHV